MQQIVTNIVFYLLKTGPTNHDPKMAILKMESRVKVLMDT